MRFEPEKFELNLCGEKNSTQIVKLNYERYGKEKESYSEIILVNILGGYSTSKTVSVTVIPAIYPKLTFLDDNKEIFEEVDFGSTFYGKSKTLTGVLVNNGSESLNFSVIQAPKEENDTRVGLESSHRRIKRTENFDGNEAENFFSFSPTDGIVKPFSETKIVITYLPIQDAKTHGFEKQFIEDVKNAKILRDEFFIEIPAINQRMFLTVQGTANIPLVTVSPSILRFGMCAVHDRRDIQVRQEVSYVLFPNISCETYFFMIILSLFLDCIDVIKIISLYENLFSSFFVSNSQFPPPFGHLFYSNISFIIITPSLLFMC